jgi:hypothetical protein
MSLTAVGHCSQCDALVNRHWRSCLVCHAELSAVPMSPQVETVSAVSSSLPAPQPTWRELMTLTAGLEASDPRLTPVLGALAVCEAHDKAGDRPGFEHAAERVRYLMQFAPGVQVRWRGHEGHRLMVLGPAPVEHVHCDQEQALIPSRAVLHSPASAPERQGRIASGSGPVRWRARSRTGQWPCREPRTLRGPTALESGEGPKPPIQR